MYSNLYKSGWVRVQDEDTRVIDNNRLLEEKLKGAVLHAASVSSHRENTEEDGFLGGLEAEAVDALFDSDGSGAVIKGDAAAERDALLQEIEEAKAELLNVQAQADQMMEEAKAGIGAMQMKAYEEAQTQGYEEGSRKGFAEAESIKNEYLEKQRLLEAEYRQKMEALEPEFVETLTGIYEHIFKVDLSSYKGLVTGLLTSTMQKMDNCRSFLIHVSKADYEKVMADKEKILAEAGMGKTSAEFVEDMTLPEAQCYIETENGIYDCGLDTQLKELKKKLILLAYEK